MSAYHGELKDTARRGADLDTAVVNRVVDSLKERAKRAKEKRAGPYTALVLAYRTTGDQRTDFRPIDTARTFSKETKDYR